MSRIPFEQLPVDVHQAVADKTGAVHRAVTESGGMNSGIASVLTTESGSVFVNGIPSDHPQVGAQRREASVAPHLPASCPRLYWHLELEGWSLLGYEVVDGRHADYAPGSPDLPLVEAALAELQGITAPADVEIKDAVDRWADYAPPGTLQHFDGDALLHTDYAPDNVLIVGGRARLVDWAWPTRGAAWIDPGALALRLMDAGHPVKAAVAFAGRFPSWRDAEPEVLGAFGAATAALWREIAEEDGTPWKPGDGGAGGDARARPRPGRVGALVSGCDTRPSGPHPGVGPRPGRHLTCAYFSDTSADSGCELGVILKD